MYRALFTAFIFLAAITAGRAEITMKPYLQSMTCTSAYLLIETDSENEVRVLYGPDQTTSMFHNTNYILPASSEKPRYVHRIELDNLKPGTKYYYRVMQDGVDTPLESFTTPPDKGKLKIAVSGDSRSAPKTWKKVITAIDKESPDILMLTGDLAVKPDYDAWKKEFFIPELLKFAKSTSFFNAVGNHEGWAEDTKAFTQAPKSPSFKQEYYSFEIGNALFIVLSTEHKIGKGSHQYNFLDTVLKKSKHKWKFVSFHKSAYVGGGHGEYKPMKDAAKLMAKYKVDIAFSGHSHFYQRNFVDGVYHLTVAGGGASLYKPKKMKYTQKSVKEHHYGIIDLDFDGNTMKFKAVNLKGKVIDSFEIKK